MSKLLSYEVDNPYWVTYLKWTPISKWCVVRGVSFKEIRLHAQNVIAIVSSIINRIRETYMTT